MINDHQGGVECRSPSTPPRWCLLLLVAPGARGALARLPCRSCTRRSRPRGGFAPHSCVRLALRRRCRPRAALVCSRIAARLCRVARSPVAPPRVAAPDRVRVAALSASLRGRFASAPPLRARPAVQAGPPLAPRPRLMRAPRLRLGVRRRFWAGFGRRPAALGRRSSAPVGAQGARALAVARFHTRARAPPPGAGCVVCQCVACRQCVPVGIDGAALPRPLRGLRPLRGRTGCDPLRSRISSRRRQLVRECV